MVKSYSVGIGSSLNQQMGAYRLERDAEDTNNRRLRYKMVKKKLEEQGLDTSAQKIASMLTRVSRVIEGEPSIGKEGTRIPVLNQQSAVEIILKGIRDKNLNEVWQRIVKRQNEIKEAERETARLNERHARTTYLANEHQRQYELGREVAIKTSRAAAYKKVPAEIMQRQYELGREVAIKTAAYKKVLAEIMQREDVKNTINQTLHDTVNSSKGKSQEEIDAIEEKAADSIYKTLKEQMPSASPDTVIDDSFADLNSEVETAETGTTVEGAHGERTQMKIPKSFDVILEGNYTKATQIFRKGADKRSKVQFLKGAELIVVPTSKGNQLRQRGNKGIAYTPITLEQYAQLKLHAPIL